MSKTIFLNKNKVLRKLIQLAKKAKVQDKNISKIVLFGSIAENNYTGTSDADILIILKESPEPFINRLPRYLNLFLDSPVPVDIFPYTEREAEETPLAQRGIRIGITLT